jgi:hypothetical protein
MCVVVLVHAAQRARIASMFPFVVVTGSFLVLNVVGSFSDNISAFAADRYYWMLFSEGMTVVVAYGLCLKLLPIRHTAQLLAESAERAASQTTGLRLLIGSLLGLSIVALLVAALTVGKPLVLDSAVFGNLSLLVARRTEIVFGSGIFQWLSIGLYELPLLCVILTFYLVALNGVCRPALPRPFGLLAATTLVVASALALSFLHKMPLAYVLAGAACGILVGRGSVGRRVLIGVPVAGFILMATLYGLFEGWLLSSRGWDLLTKVLWHRIFEAYAWTGALAASIFPEHANFLDGRSVLNPGGMFQVDQFDLSRYLYPFIYGAAEGSAPAPSAMEMYANFGWTGFVVSLLIIGGALVALCRLFVSACPVNRSIGIYLSLKLSLVWQAAFWFGALEPTLVIAMGLVQLLWVVSANSGRAMDCHRHETRAAPVAVVNASAGT